MNIKQSIVSCLAALVLSCTTLTWAAPLTPGAGGGPCADDIKRLCADVRGGRNVAQCLNEHDADVSDACKAHQKMVVEKGKTFMQACRGDIQNLCKDVKPGEGRTWTCIKSREADLSGDCKEFVTGQ